MNYICSVSLFIALMFTCLSCIDRKQTGIMSIPVDTYQDVSLPLSEITTEIKAIELEMTDKSLVNRIIRRIVYCDPYIAVLDNEKIMLFDQDGHFVRQIGSKGNGPGEFVNIIDITVDTQRGYLYALTIGKLICYQLDGKFIKEEAESTTTTTRYINYVNNELLMISEYFKVSDGKDTFNRSVIYKVNDDLQVADSIEIRKVIDPKMFWVHQWNDFISMNEKNNYLYYFEFNPEPFLRDTLFQMEDDRLIPDLRLDFKDRGFDSSGEKITYISNIYRSSRFVFSIYVIQNAVYHFCYDIKTGKGYNMKNGYTDDVHQLPERVNIRPFNNDAGRFYYLYTHLNNADGEEPNPTLYIGVLKK